MDNDNNVAQTKYTYNKIYKEYAESNPVASKEVKQSLDQFISLLSGKVILDVGCASGRESEYMNKKGFDVTGCDISEELIELAKQRCPDCRFFVADMRSINEPSDSYDGLWVNASFLHVPKKDAPETLRNFYKILKSDGILFLSVMKGDFDSLRDNKDMDWPERHFSDYQESELSTSLEQSGFKIVANKSNPTSWGKNFLHFFCKKK